jgi:hypothetical protein
LETIFQVSFSGAARKELFWIQNNFHSSTDFIFFTFWRRQKMFQENCFSKHAVFVEAAAAREAAPRFVEAAATREVAPLFILYLFFILSRF